MFNATKFFVLVSLILWGAACTPNKSVLSIPNSIANNSRPLRVYVYRSPKAESGSRVLFVMHGVRRNAEEYLDSWKREADRRHLIVVAPEFPKDAYPNYGQVPISEGEDDTTLEKIFRTVVKDQNLHATEYYLYGHSAGAQFVHRYVMFHSHAHVAKAVAANAGWYTFPDPKRDIPYGINGVNVAVIKEALEKDLTLLLGEDDVNSEDPNLRNSTEAKRQGANRLERGRHFFEAAQQFAVAQNATFNWKIKTVPMAGHHNTQMLETAAKVLFDR